jgi:hypothetical protein
MQSLAERLVPHFVLGHPVVKVTLVEFHVTSMTQGSDRPVVGLDAHPLSMPASVRVSGDDSAVFCSAVLARKVSDGFKQFLVAIVQT